MGASERRSGAANEVVHGVHWSRAPTVTELVTNTGDLVRFTPTHHDGCSVAAL
jgi:hypothetical protein